MGPRGYCPRKRPSGLAEALSNAACEWLLIFLLFVDSFLTFVVMKFARYCKLEAPCFLCTRLNRVVARLIDTVGYYDFICGHHKLEVSSLVFCYSHRNLAIGSGMCEDCLFSIDTQNQANTSNQENNLSFLLYKLGLSLLACSFENSSCSRDPASSASNMEARFCSCCQRPWTAREKVQKLLRLKPCSNRNDNGGCSRSNGGKPSVPLPHLPSRFRISRRSSLKRIREKLSSSVRGQNNFNKSGFGSLPRGGYTKLKISSDSEPEDSRPAECSIPKPPVKTGNAEANNVQCPNCGITLNQDVRHIGQCQSQGRSELPALICLDDFPPSTGGDKVSDGPTANKVVLVEIVKPTSLVDVPLPSVISTEKENGVVAWEHSNGQHANGKSSGKQTIHFATNEGHGSSLSPMNGSETDSSEDFVNRNTSDAGSSSEEQMGDLIHPNGTNANDEAAESVDDNTKDVDGKDSVVNRLRRQIERDQEHITDLYKELEEERNASAVATSEAMAMITRLQEEKAALHMEAMQYLRMMEEQAEHDVEALEKASDLLADREKEIQDLESELDYYRVKYPEDEAFDELTA
ncbi:hypothetical protein MLD38_028061 [Melastoma candidum]|uniref:Uncharacterized protein n=1 Tax=Melastoma candidum TaxID=119954 RepID=A0ACB9MZZ9_9MYRT|nr:hypothetical protein MLD38_028061 [Melastoma candidum]